MSRTTQFVGHTFDNENFLRSCKKIDKIGEVIGMFDECVENLYRYLDNRGIVWEEYVQAEPWDSGPVIFLGLRGSNGENKGWRFDPEISDYDYKSGTYYV